MLAHSRNLLLFCALAGGALLSWALARRADTPLPPPIDDSLPAGRGYYMQNAVLNATGASGRLSYRIHAGRLELASRDDDFELEGVRVEYLPESEIRWGLTAASGVMRRDRALLELGDVLLSSASLQGDTETRFETSFLQLDTERLVATTDQPVAFQSGETVLHARGLDVNLETDVYVLEADVMTQRAALAGGVLALLALDAQGQPAAVSGGDTLDCPQGITGSVPVDDFECRDFSIRLGESTRMSADTAWAKTARFDRGEVRLRGSIRIVIDGTELTADSGSAIADGDEISKLSLTGSPVRITHAIEGSDSLVTGEARSISYDRSSDTFELQGDVQFASNAGESAITACSLTFKPEEMTFNMPPEEGCERAFSLERSSSEEARDEPSAGP